MDTLEKEIKYFLSDPLLFISLFFALIVLIRYWKVLNKQSKQVGGIVLLYAIMFLVTSQLSLFAVYSSWIYNVMYIPISYCIWKLFSQEVGFENLKRQILLIFSIITFLHVCNLIFFQGIVYIATATMMLFQLFNAVLAFLYLKFRLENYDEPVHLNIINWFAFAVIIDNIVSIPTTALWSKEMYELIGHEQFALLNNIQSFLYACWYLIIAFGILWNTTSLSSRFSSSS